MQIETQNKWLGGAEKPLVPGHPLIRIEVRPIDDDLRDEAQAAYRAVMAKVPADDDGSPLPQDAQVFGQRAWKAYENALMLGGITAIEGFTGDKGEALTATPTHIAAIIRHPDVRDGLVAQYTAPFMLRSMEKNVSAPSPNGTSARAGTAETKTRAAKAKAVASSAPTPATPHRRRPAKVSGAS